jgi:hypothetical protein
MAETFESGMEQGSTHGQKDCEMAFAFWERR